MIISIELEKVFGKIQYQFTAALFPMAKNWKQAKCLTTEEQRHKRWCVRPVKQPDNEATEITND